MIPDGMDSVVKRPTDRRSVLFVAGVAAAAMAALQVAAQSADVRGTVTFEGGAAIPEGRLEIYLDDPAIQDQEQRRSLKTLIESNGKSKAITFSLSPPANSAAPLLRIVARLERKDGWLLARGSARFEAGSPLEIALSAVMY